MLDRKRIELISSYIDKLNSLESSESDQIFHAIRVIVNTFRNDIVDLEDTVTLINNPKECLEVTRNLLIKFLSDNGVDYICSENDNVFSKFWLSFITWFENEIPKNNFKDNIVEYVGFNEYEFNFDYQYKLFYGIEYSTVKFDNLQSISMFIELAYSSFIKNDKRYDFTIYVNELFKRFHMPYKIDKGKIKTNIYRTNNISDEIINYLMLERKISYSEEIILNSDTLDKKTALDYIVAAFNYLISIQPGKHKSEKIQNAAKTINSDTNSKGYSVIIKEISEINTFSNEYFDIRHNEEYNTSKELREALSDNFFIEYLYNRIYAIVYLLKLKHSSK